VLSHVSGETAAWPMAAQRGWDRPGIDRLADQFVRVEGGERDHAGPPRPP
jgi:hypothetical protein